MNTYYLIKQNSWGSAVVATFSSKDDATREMKEREAAQSHRPYRFQLYYYIIDEASMCAQSSNL